jgi:NADPH:quinone reductase-like Zn-dependent oxidoreductase
VSKIREGLLHERWPATLPSGQGSDLAGVVEQAGDGADGFAVGDEVIGYTDNRASHAELVLVDADNATRRPSSVPWEVAGSLAPERIDTIVDFAAVEKHGVKAQGNAAGASAETLAVLAGLIAEGALEIPIARVYPLDHVRDAYRELEQGHTHGKIVLTP